MSPEPNEAACTRPRELVRCRRDLDAEGLQFGDEGLGQRDIPQRTCAVRERLLVVTRFLRSYLPGFEYGIDLTRGGPLEECRRKGGIFSDHSELNFAVPPRPPRLRTNWRGWDDWDSLWLHARLDDRWR
jgi:hypothetical protein